jgi:hypothetical protein
MKLRLFIFLAGGAALLSGAGCAFHQKSYSRIYEGDAPTIKYTSVESAGGPLGGR